MTGSDVAGLISAINSKDNNSFFGDGIWGIIMLLIVAGIFTGGYGFGNAGVAAGATRAEIDSEFAQRDIFNTNTNVLENRYANAVASANTDKEVLENRYANALNTQSIISSQKDCCCENKILGLQNTYELSQLADRNNFNTLLGNKDLTAAINADGDKTRALITAQYEASLLEKINDLKSELSNKNQNEVLLNTLGTWRANPSCGCGLTACPYTTSSSLI